MTISVTKNCESVKFCLKIKLQISVLFSMLPNKFHRKQKILISLLSRRVHRRLISIKYYPSKNVPSQNSHIFVRPKKVLIFLLAWIFWSCVNIFWNRGLCVTILSGDSNWWPKKAFRGNFRMLVIRSLWQKILVSLQFQVIIMV